MQDIILKIGSFLQFNIIMNRVVPELIIKVFLLTVVWHENDGGVYLKWCEVRLIIFCAIADLCHSKRGNFSKFT